MTTLQVQGQLNDLRISLHRADLVFGVVCTRLTGDLDERLSRSEVPELSFSRHLAKTSPSCTDIHLRHLRQGSRWTTTRMAIGMSSWRLLVCWSLTQTRPLHPAVVGILGVPKSPHHHKAEKNLQRGPARQNSRRR